MRLEGRIIYVLSKIGLGVRGYGLIFLVPLVFLYSLRLDSDRGFGGVVGRCVGRRGCDGTPSLATTDADCYGKYDKQ